jgi:hypothetical protein
VQRQLLAWKSTITRASQNSVRVLIIKKLGGQQTNTKQYSEDAQVRIGYLHNTGTSTDKAKANRENAKGLNFVSDTHTAVGSATAEFRHDLLYPVATDGHPDYAVYCPVL